MWPRSADRGNYQTELRAHTFKEASMGPRSADRGNRGRSGLGDTATIASMGPRSADRGNMVEVRSIDRLNNLLQWGRDQLIAEIGIAFNCALKQARASSGRPSAAPANGHLYSLIDAPPAL